MMRTLWMNSERGALTAALGAALILPLSGCVTINAPEKPIRIDLNINVTQEVVYRLDKESKNLIEDNPDIFGGS